MDQLNAIFIFIGGLFFESLKCGVLVGEVIHSIVFRQKVSFLTTLKDNDVILWVEPNVKNPYILF